jgi:DNA-binding NtrC family response regulator
MAVKVLVLMQDATFRETLKERLQRQRISVFTSDNARDSAGIIVENDIDVVLFDVRGLGRQAMHSLAEVRGGGGQAEVILLSSFRAGDIALSIEGMRQGAADDITEPFELGNIIAKIHEGWERKKARIVAPKKRSLRAMFQNAMAAATFAQAGEFDTAQELSSGKTAAGGKINKRQQ